MSVLFGLPPRARPSLCGLTEVLEEHVRELMRHIDVFAAATIHSASRFILATAGANVDAVFVSFSAGDNLKVEEWEKAD